MKLIKIFAIVFSLHLFAICFLFVLPGCTTTKNKEPEAAAPAVADSGEMGMGTGNEVKEMHPDFNAGLSGSGETATTRPLGRYAPTRPSWDFETATEESAEEVLKPVYKEPMEPETDLPQSSFDDSSTRLYTVKSGDTLSKIARKFGTTVAAIKRANALQSDLIRVRDTLVIPGGGGSGVSLSMPVSTPKYVKKEAPAAAEAIHIVASGDTPSGIARQYGMSAKNLMRINHITDPTKLQIGQRLFVNAPQGAPTSAPRSASASRTVLEEDRSMTPSAIDERERSLLDEEEDIPVIPLDSDEGGGGGSTD